MLGLGSSINRPSISSNIPVFTGLLDESFGGSAAAAYSVRRLSSSADTAMTIRRDSDNSETDIGFDANGNIDESAISTFCTGTTCKISNWKDQSGNNNHAVQTTAAQQPIIYTGGEIVKIDGRTAMTLDGQNDGFEISSNIVGAYSIFTLGNPNGNDRYYQDSSFGGRQYVIRNSSVAGSFLTYQNGIVTSYLYEFAKELVGFISNSPTTLYTNTLLMRYTNSGGYFGEFSEYIIYTTGKSTAERTDIESNIGDYYTQNTPLLDTYTGAAAAYSLRKLRSDYSGSAVKVRRDNDNLEADIGFNMFKELDTVALAAHCGSNNGYVTTWFDQSSNSNDAEQDAAGSQPKIYDGTTGVVTENGKPAVEFDGTDDWLDLGTNQLGTTELFADSGDAFSIYQYATIDTEGTVFSKAVSTNTQRDYQLYYQNTWQYYIRGTVTLTGITEKRMLASFNWDGTTSNASFNGASQSINVGTAGKSTQDINIGSRSDGGFFLDGKNQELIIYDSSKSATDRTSIEENINTFYSIY